MKFKSILKFVVRTVPVVLSQAPAVIVAVREVTKAVKAPPRS